MRGQLGGLCKVRAWVRARICRSGGNAVFALPALVQKRTMAMSGAHEAADTSTPASRVRGIRGISTFFSCTCVQVEGECA